jgi:hypothetical protein
MERPILTAVDLLSVAALASVSLPPRHCRAGQQADYRANSIVKGQRGGVPGLRCFLRKDSSERDAEVAALSWKSAFPPPTNAVDIRPKRVPNELQQLVADFSKL